VSFEHRSLAERRKEFGSWRWTRCLRRPAASGQPAGEKRRKAADRAAGDPPIGDEGGGRKEQKTYEGGNRRRIVCIVSSAGEEKEKKGESLVIAFAIRPSRPDGREEKKNLRQPRSAPRSKSSLRRSSMRGGGEGKRPCPSGCHVDQNGKKKKKEKGLQRVRSAPV